MDTPELESTAAATRVDGGVWGRLRTGTALALSLCCECERGSHTGDGVMLNPVLAVAAAAAACDVLRAVEVMLPLLALLTGARSGRAPIAIAWADATEDASDFDVVLAMDTELERDWLLVMLMVSPPLTDNGVVSTNSYAPRGPPFSMYELLITWAAIEVVVVVVEEEAAAVVVDDVAAI